jgi:hypothetical protein
MTLETRVVDELARFYVASTIAMASDSLLPRHMQFRQPAHDNPSPGEVMNPLYSDDAFEMNSARQNELYISFAPRSTGPQADEDKEEQDHVNATYIPFSGVSQFREVSPPKSAAATGRLPPTPVYRKPIPGAAPAAAPAPNDDPETSFRIALGVCHFVIGGVQAMTHSPSPRPLLRHWRSASRPDACCPYLQERNREESCWRSLLLRHLLRARHWSAQEQDGGVQALSVRSWWHSLLGVELTWSKRPGEPQSKGTCALNTMWGSAIAVHTASHATLTRQQTFWPGQPSRCRHLRHVSYS